MSKQSLYLKFRPSQLEDLVGQKSFVQTMKQSCKYDRYAHAYMLSGTRGCGKTSSARIIANLMNCENIQDGKVCGSCKACQTIPLGLSMDVVELDGGQKGKVEDVTNLIESATWSPQELKKKIFIIDECHRLTPSAISALLKITEEPPSYLVFIFCTTEPEKMPVAILSRTQNHQFHQISSIDIAKRLKYISEKEGIKVDDGALMVVARTGRGSMRDAISALEKIAIAAGEGSITEAAATKFLGVADRRGIYEIIGSMLKGNYSLVMDQCNDMIVASVDVHSLLFETSEAFRNIFMTKLQGEKTKLVDLPDHEIKKLAELGKSIDLGQLDKLSREFSTIEKELTFSINKRWIVESILIRCTARLEKK